MTDGFDATRDSQFATPPPPPPLGGRFIDVVTAPAKAMAAVAAQPAWLVPASVLFALMFLYRAANVHVLVPAQLEMTLEAGGAGSEAIHAQMDLFTDPPVWLRVVSGLGAGFTVVVFSLLVPGLILHLFTRLSSGSAELKQTLGVVFWAGLIAYGLRTVLGWIVLVATGEARYAGLTAASFLHGVDPQSVLFSVAGLYGDPFMYWTLWVVAIGLATCHRLPLGRAVTVVAATYVLGSALPIGMAIISQAFSNM